MLMDLIIKCLRGPLHAQTPVLSYIKLFKAHCVKSDPIEIYVILQVHFLNWLNTLRILTILVQIHNRGALGCKYI